MLFARVALCACLLHAAPVHAATNPVRVIAVPVTGTDEEQRAAAKAAFREGRQAAADGDYSRALVGFERARALEPSPGIHYNIAVCHHRLMLQADEGTEPYDARRQQAIEAYNLYLDAAPEADDRATVEDLIVSLGGHPVTRPRWTIERLDPTPEPSPELRDDDPREPEPEPEQDTRVPADVAPAPTSAELSAEPSGATSSTAARLPRARVGVGFVLMASNMRELSKTGDVETLPMLGLSVRGGAFLGPRHRINLGGEIALAGQTSATQTKHRLTAGHIGVTLDYAHPIGKRRRFEIGGGGLVGVAGQGLRHRGVSSVTCPTRSDTEGDRDVSTRAGMLLGGRFGIAALLGRRRNHELALRITPGLGLFGAGQKGSQTVMGESCDGQPTPFEEVGMNGPALVVTVDLGYAPRF
jgi:hypothetical protein